jgi:DNA invertase Pin-like site-specific DNA recombinase
MKRAAIYARFSTDLQNERSVEDQIALCEDYARREGYAVVAKYEDRPRSGASVLGRDGLLKLLDDARTGLFDVLITEALDRLSRDMEDLAGIYKRFSFLGIEIRAVHEGQANTVLIGLRGLVGQLYREDNVHKIKRGMAGLVKQGLYAGGLAYGYAPVAGEKGKRLIVEKKAQIIRRIFNEYLAGSTPRQIAFGLNRDGVPPPRGTKWNASTINGNRQRGNGILHNEIYMGRMVWNRVRMVKHPDTGRRISRVNPESDWKYFDMPELAIVTPETFKQAQERKAVRTSMTRQARRAPRRLLSGLLRCGACGSGMSVYGLDKSGRARVRCTRHAESRTCPDPQSFYVDVIERTVLEGLSQELRDPRIISEYVRTYHEERQRLAAKAARERKSTERLAMWALTPCNSRRKLAFM